MRSRYCRACGNFHDIEEPWPDACSAHFARYSTGGGLQVISDTMEPTLHPATGKHIASKSRFRAETRAAGCVEVGNERMAPRQVDYADISGRDIKQAIEPQLNSGNRSR